MKLPSNCDEQRPDYDSSSSKSLESISEPNISSDTDNDSLSDGLVGYPVLFTNGSVSQGSSNTSLAVVTHSSNVLDRLMASPVQSYQELLESFTYLTADDISRTMLNHSLRLQSFCQQLQQGATAPPDEVIVDGFLQQSIATCSDPLDELTLSDVDMAPSYSRPKVSLKVDNFVDDESEEQSTVDSCSMLESLGFTTAAYSPSQASFISQGQEKSYVSQPAELSVLNADNNLPQTVPCSLLDTDDYEYSSAGEYLTESVVYRVTQLSPGDDREKDEDGSVAVTVGCVEPFRLDDDFDYDSAPTSMKYNAVSYRSRD